MSQPLIITTLDQAHDAVSDYMKDYGVTPDSDAYDEMYPDMVTAVTQSINDPALIRDFCGQTLGWVTADAQRRINELIAARPNSITRLTRR